MLSGIFIIGITYQSATPLSSFKPNSVSVMTQHRDFTLHSSSKSCEHAARAEIFYSRIMHADLRIKISMFIYHKHKPILLVHLVLFNKRCNFAALICLKHLKLRVKCKYIAHKRELYMRAHTYNYFTQNHFPIKCRGLRCTSHC
jgi:hypothetical protein